MHAVPPRARVLVFCVALNHYDRIYAANLRSHRGYAQRNGYSYALVREPTWATVREAVWLKIALLEAALAAGWDWVVFVDADCEITARAPPVEDLDALDGAVFLAPGFSGAFNSGVIIARGAPAARSFFTQVLDAAGLPVPEEDWGENGHVIHFAKRCAAVTRLDRRWNNNADPDLDDYIRHYSAGGPMRALYPYTLQGKAVTLVVRVVGRLRKLAGRHDVPRDELTARLRRAAAWIAGRLPAFAHAPAAAEPGPSRRARDEARAAESL
ncbi:MAG TPA: hypothetical protein VIL72_13365 [Beijerinckiaceae bacterium]